MQIKDNIEQNNNFENVNSQEEDKVENVIQNDIDNNAVLESSGNIESLLSDTDLQFLNNAILNLGKYDRVKHSLLNDPKLNISKEFRGKLENDEFKNSIEGKIEKVCKDANIPTINDLPFTSGEEGEIKKIIADLYKSGCDKENIVREVSFNIKNNSSPGLKETWNTLRSQFDSGSHLMFYLTREYVEKMSSDMFNELQKDKNNEGMEM